MARHDEDYQVILEKITQDKEERQKNLQELKKRKKEIERKLFFEHYHEFSNTQSKPPRQALSSDRRDVNKKIFEHLQSPTSKLPKQLKPRHLNRFEEEEAKNQNNLKFKQMNRLKMVEKRNRYANIVKEIFTPTIDLKKQQEIEKRVLEKTRSAYASRGGSPVGFLTPIASSPNLRQANALHSAARVSLSPNT